MGRFTVCRAILAPQLSHKLQFVYDSDDYSGEICVLIAARVHSLPTHPPPAPSPISTTAFINLSVTFEHLRPLTFIARWYPFPAIVTEHNIDDLTLPHSHCSLSPYVIFFDVCNFSI